MRKTILLNINVVFLFSYVKMAGLDEQHDNDFDGNAGNIFAIQEMANAKRETTQNNHGPDHGDKGFKENFVRRDHRYSKGN